MFDDERAEGLRDPMKDETTDMEFQKLKQLETTCLISCSQTQVEIKKQLSEKPRTRFNGRYGRMYVSDPAGGSTWPARHSKLDGGMKQDMKLVKTHNFI